MRSYWAWVPTNFTQTIPAWYCISTNSLYLLPPTLNTTRLLPQMLACETDQTDQSQNFFKLLFAITRIGSSISRFGRCVNETE